MSDKGFVFSEELSKRLIQLRFENEWLFKKRKQPWKDFHKLLLENGFPEEMTAKHVNKKWYYLYESYRIAKKTKNKNWKYYKEFNNYYGKTQVVLDKYESWNDEWREKLINCMLEAKDLRHDFKNMWIAVEKGLRSQNLPEDCCIQDIKGLWHHIRMTFNRKYRLKLRKGSTDWPLFDAMLAYCSACDPGALAALAAGGGRQRARKCSLNYLTKEKADYDEYDFQWTKDITETFIQVRLQHDWLFRERKWAWNDLLEIMVKEYGFPKLLTGREICRKWASTFSEYQKALATNNKSWMYYRLFELYLGEGVLSFDMLKGWQEEWVCNLISARIDLEHLFKLTYKDQTSAWREVEKKLRSVGLPVDHSLLELPEIWKHLERTFKWKKKFSKKGILTEQWPYFDAMAQYEAIQPRHPIRQPTETSTQKQEHELSACDAACDNDDFEDDIKLFDLKQRLDREVKPKLECLEDSQCRSCSGEDGCVNIYQHCDEHGLNLADKLRVIGDVKVEPTDNLPSQICLNCFKDLENAFKFRRKCQKVDKQLRNPSTIHPVKVEVMADDGDEPKDEPHITDDLDNHFDDLTDVETKVKKPRRIRRERHIPKKKRKVRKTKYEYYKICDQCGKYTKNLKNHLDTHASGKFYSCEICDKKFKFKSGLVIHKAVHDTTPKKTCEICGKTFHILAQYRRHFVYHANERKYECETCGKRFNTSDILRVHNRTHTDERPFPCPICGKTFRTAGCVSRHKRIVHRTTKNQIQ